MTLRLKTIRDRARAIYGDSIRFSVYLSLLIIILVSPAAAATTEVVDTSNYVHSDVPATMEFRKLSVKNMRVGEKATFSVRFMGIPCGEVILNVAEKKKYRRRDVYVVTVYAYTNKFFSKIHAVSDTLITYIDAEGLFSWRYEKDFNDDGDTKQVVYQFDHVKGNWYANNVYEGKLQKNSQDLISSLFYFRNAHWDDDADSINVPLNDTRKNYKLSLELAKKTRKIKSKIGWKKCRIGRPLLIFGDKFKQIGKSDVWFTNDEKRVPVLVKSKLLLGSFYGKLIKYEAGE